MNFKQAPYVPGWPKGAQRPAKGSPRASQKEPQEPKGRPKGAQGLPKESKRRPKSAQGTPKALQRHPKEAKGEDIYQKLPINRPSGRYVNVVASLVEHVGSEAF